MAGHGHDLVDGAAALRHVGQATLAKPVRRAARGQSRLGDLRREPIGEALIGERSASGADQPLLQAGGHRSLDRGDQLRRDRRVNGDRLALAVLVLDVFQERGGAAILKVSGIGVGQADGDRVGAAQRQRVDP